MSHFFSIKDLQPEVTSTKYVTSYLKKYKDSISEVTQQLNQAVCGGL
jgi:hypothetical protein